MGAGPVNMSGTFSFREENDHFHDSRAEAKKAHAERMLLLRQVSQMYVCMYVRINMIVCVLTVCMYA